MAQADWIETELAAKLRSMAGFRNLLVHGYGDIDLSIVRRIVEEDLGDLDDFVRQVKARF
jgi:uncharacterized protein YutE (UPF0331/DUF86 family)